MKTGSAVSLNLRRRHRPLQGLKHCGAFRLFMSLYTRHELNCGHIPVLGKHAPGGLHQELHVTTRKEQDTNPFFATGKRQSRIPLSTTSPKACALSYASRREASNSALAPSTEGSGTTFASASFAGAEQGGKFGSGRFRGPSSLGLESRPFCPVL